MTELEKKFHYVWKAKKGKLSDLWREVGKIHTMRLSLMGYIETDEEAGTWKLSETGEIKLGYRFSFIQILKKKLKKLWNRI